MADLEIGPQPVSYQTPTPQYPSTAPVLEETEKDTEKIQSNLQKASYLAASIMRQQDNHTAAAAIVDYKDQVNGLDEKVANVQDLNTRLGLVKSGLSNIFGTIKDKYPSLPPTALKSIELEMSNDYHQHYLKTVTEKVAQGQRDLKYLGDESTRLAASAKSEGERKRIEGNYLNYLHQSVANGVIHQDEADDFATKFSYGVKLEQAQNLLNQDPTKVLSLTPTDGFKPADLYGLHTRALHIINQANAAGLKSWHDIKSKSTEAAVTGQMGPGELLNAYRHGEIPSSVYRFKTGEAPPEESNPELVDHFRSRMDSISDPEELQKYYEEEVVPSLGRHPSAVDSRVISEHFHDLKSQLGSKFKQDTVDQYKDLQDQFNDKTMGMGKYFSMIPEYRHALSTLKAAGKAMNDAKTVEERNTVYQKYQKNMNDNLDKLFPKARTPDTGEPVAVGTPSATEEFNKP